MCLIAFVSKSKSIPDEHINASYTRNSNGFGVMAVADGRVKIVKGLFNLEQIKVTLKAFEGLDYVCHFRYRTSGRVDEQNCHPFKVLSIDDGDASDLYMVHNGILSDVKAKDDQSDTMVFVQEYLRPLLKKKPELLHKRDFQDLLKDAIGHGNKLIFMDNTGKVTIINENAGHKDNGVWYSNRYSLATKNWSSTKASDQKSCDFMHGDYHPEITEFESNSVAQKCGFQPGDIIYKMDGEKVFYWKDCLKKTREGNGRPIKFEIYRPKKRKIVTITAKPALMKDADGKEIFKIGILSSGTQWVPEVDTSAPIKSAEESAKVFEELTTADVIAPADSTVVEKALSTVKRVAKDIAQSINTPQY